MTPSLMIMTVMGISQAVEGKLLLDAMVKHRHGPFHHTLFWAGDFPAQFLQQDLKHRDISGTGGNPVLKLTAMQSDRE